MLSSTDGGCRAARTLIDPYVSDELDEVERTEVARHLEVCPPCAGAFREAECLKQLVRRAVRSETAPEQFRRRISDLIRKG